MKKIVTHLFVVLTLPFFVACGVDVLPDIKPEDISKNIEEATRESGLQGKTFSSDCSLRAFDRLPAGISGSGENVLRSSREQYQFIGDNIIHTIQLYKTENCQGRESIVFKEAGSFEVDTTQESQDDGKFIDINYRNLGVQILDDLGANIAKDLKMCANTDWSTGTIRDVTAHAHEATCYQRALPADVKDIYLIDDEDLYFGVRDQAQTVGERPAALDKSNKFTDE